MNSGVEVEGQLPTSRRQIRGVDSDPGWLYRGGACINKEAPLPRKRQAPAGVASLCWDSGASRNPRLVCNGFSLSFSLRFLFLTTSPCVSDSVCLSVSLLSLSLFLAISLFRSLWLSHSVSLSLYVSLSVSLSVSLFLSLCLSLSLSVCLSVSVCLCFLLFLFYFCKPICFSSYSLVLIISFSRWLSLSLSHTLSRSGSHTLSPPKHTKNNNQSYCYLLYRATGV